MKRCSAALVILIGLLMAGAAHPASAGATNAPQVTQAGYWIAAADGGVFTYGDAAFYGSMGGQHLNAPVVGLASTPDGGGYWLVAADGGIFAFGDAAFHGSAGAQHLNAQIVGMVSTPDGGGYWLVAADGGVFAYGDAAFYGSAGAQHVNAPVVGMAAAPDGGGYWLVAADGGVFAYGDAAFYGSAGAQHLNAPVVGMSATTDDGGYWLVAADGGVFSYGDAPFEGSAGGLHLTAPAVGMAPAMPDAYGSTVQYVETFYPRWFTYQQSLVLNPNQLIGPSTMSPVYQSVVAINDDTVYGSAFVDLSNGPVILTLPETSDVYSLLTLDLYGDVFTTNVPSPGTPGAPGKTYALTGPGWSGTLPNGVTQVPVPYDLTEWIIRADNYSPAGVNMIAAANAFRAAMRAEPLSTYLTDPTGGATKVVPVADFAVPFKTVADADVANTPIQFLKQTQVAVHDSNTVLNTQEQIVSNEFDSWFGNGKTNSQELQTAFSQGAQAAQAQILNNYLDNVGPTNWITFDNIGNWGSDYLDRSSIAEFLQYGNGHDTAAYFHAFKDSTGAALDGSSHSYVLTFPADNIPQTSRFWSLTAYTPDAIELVPNSADKYVVGSYTPGLVKNPDGSISIYMSQSLPPGVPAANWLPIPDGPFNAMLRDYGPAGSVADNTYVPPGITTYP